MANIIIHTEAGVILKYLKSAHTPDYADRSDVLINVDIPEGDIRRMLVEEGAVRHMTSAECDECDLAEAPSYSELRNDAYPEVGEQLDMLWHAMDAGLIDMAPEWHDAILTIKEAYPKPGV